MHFNKIKTAALLAVIAMVALVPAAQATVEVKITDAANPLGMLFPGVSCGVNCSTAVAFLSDADFSINIHIGSSNAPGGPAKLTLSGTVTTSPLATMPQDLTVEISDVGFVLPSGAASLIQTANTNTPASGEAKGTFTATGYYGNSPSHNVFFCQETACDGSTTTASFTSFDVTNPGQIGSVGANFVTPFSLDEVVKYHFTAGGTAVTSVTLSTSVPEPASVALLGGALLFVAGAIRRKTKKA